MRLTCDHSPGAYAVRVACYVCGSTYRLADMVSDLDGPAFVAYYCPEDRPKAHVSPCTHVGCTRCTATDGQV